MPKNFFFGCGDRNHFFYFLELRFDENFCGRIRSLWRWTWWPLKFMWWI